MTKRIKTTRRSHSPVPEFPPATYIATPTLGRCVLDSEHQVRDAAGDLIPVTVTDGRLCHGHRFDLDHFTDGIKHMWFTLAFCVEPSTSGDRAGGSRSKASEAAAAIDLVAAALRDHRNSALRVAGDIPSVPGVVAHWVRQLAILKPLRTTAEEQVGWRIYPDGSALPVTIPVSRPSPLPSSVIAQLDLLRRHHDWIAEQDWVHFYWQQLREVHTALQAKVGEPADVRSTRAIAQELADAQGPRHR